MHATLKKTFEYKRSTSKTKRRDQIQILKRKRLISNRGSPEPLYAHEF